MAKWLFVFYSHRPKILARLSVNEAPVNGSPQHNNGLPRRPHIKMITLRSYSFKISGGLVCNLFYKMPLTFVDLSDQWN